MPSVYPANLKQLNNMIIQNKVFLGKIFLVICLLVGQFLFLGAELVLAQSQTQSDRIELVNPIGGTSASPRGKTNFSEIGGNIVKTVMGILGSITLLVFIAGGIMWLTSGGNQDKVQMGSKTMLYAIIGIFVIFASYAILSMVIKGLTS